MVATAVNSSIIDVCFSFKTCKDVSTIKHKPSKFEEVLSIWEDVEFSNLRYLGLQFVNKQL